MLGGPLNSLLAAVIGVGGNLESGNTTVLSDRHVDVLDDAVGQEDHLVLARVERRSGVAGGHALNVEVPATDRRDNDPDRNRFPFFAEPLKPLREFAPKEVAVEHSRRDVRASGAVRLERHRNQVLVAPATGLARVGSPLIRVFFLQSDRRVGTVAACGLAPTLL